MNNYNNERGMLVNSERLPFTITVVSTPEELAKAVSMRQEAYGRHVPELAKMLNVPEVADTAAGAAVFLAQSKLDGSALGTIRVQSNEYEPLVIEKSIELPKRLANARLLGSARLGVVSGSGGSVVKHALLKAVYLYGRKYGFDYSVVAARPPVDRHYARLLFEDVFPEQGCVPMKHTNSIPHRVLSFDIKNGSTRFAENRHPMEDFYMKVFHPDIDVSGQSFTGTVSLETASTGEQEEALA